MRLRCLALGVAAVFAVIGAFTAPASAQLQISIDKSLQQMTVAADGETLHVWPISTGIARYDTPNGAFQPFRMERDHFSREWDDAPMPFSIFFTTRGHAIHGTYHKTLGKPASHGCVRLSVQNASALWALVRKYKMANTAIVLTGEIPAADAPAVARAEPQTDLSASRQTEDADITGALPPRSGREVRRWREYRDGERYIYYEGERPRYDRRAEPRRERRRYYDRYGGWTYVEPQPFFRFGR